MPLRRFATWAGVGAVVWAATYTAVGTAAGAAYRRYGHLGLITSLLLVGAAAGALAVRRRRRRPRAGTPASGPGARVPNEPSGEGEHDNEAADMDAPQPPAISSRGSSPC